MSDYSADPLGTNTRVIDEFRSQGGRVGGALAATPMLLLTTTGARSGNARTAPMMYMQDGERLLVFASNLGASRLPAWYENLLANPRASVEVGGEVFEVRSTVIGGEERDRLFAGALQRYPFFADHESKAGRPIPIVALQRSEGLG
jgi:deazaflavin-dependent oxidoreductase (nitroreductase family)